MPTYTVEYLKGKNKGTVSDVLMKYEEVKQLEKKGQLRIIPSAPMIVSGVGSVTGRIDNGFNDVLKGIKKANRGSTIQTK